MIVVSLFNGMGTGLEALLAARIKVDKYYSSEIKPYAIELVKHHHPEVIQVGDVTKWKEWDIDWSKVGLVLSGSPCQDLSIAGKRAGINGNKSSLFWVFIEILNHTKRLNPKVLFLQENVGSAATKDIGIMSRAMGVYPARINSSLVTAQLRDRYYWSNIRTKADGFFGDIVTDIPQPKDLKIKLQDILESGQALNEKSCCILQRQGGCYNIAKNQEYFIMRKNKRMIEAVLEKDKYRALTKVELCRLQGFNDTYLDTLRYQEAGSLLGDGWTLPIIEHIFKYI